MKNIMYGHANEWRGLPTLMQFAWIKHMRHIKYAVVHAQCLRPTVEADKKFKAMKKPLTKQLIWTWLSIINRKTGMHNYVMNIYFSSKQ